MKTPDEIKMGLDHCGTKKPCICCPMWDVCKEAAGLKPLFDNALAYIKRLELDIAERGELNEVLRDKVMQLEEELSRFKRIKHFENKNLKDITGKRFGSLIVIGRAENNPKSRNARWLCRCECGNETIVYGNNLRAGASTSCRCIRTKKNYTHSRTTYGGKTDEG